MADRYWVGGSGSWNSTSKWSTTSGGASGASVPTASDNAIFNASSGAGNYTVTVTDNATCANLTISPVALDGHTIFSIGVNFVIAGTFSTSSTAGNRRFWFRSSTYGLMRDVSIATIGTVTDVDFRGIRIIGTGGVLSGTRIGDLRQNKNITFSAPKTVYWVTVVGGNWAENNWASSSGGAASTDNFPLAQDTAVIENTGLNTSATITLNAVIPYAGTIDMSSRTNAMTLAGSSAYTIYGDWKFGSGVTRSYTGSLTFSGGNTQTITSAGKSFAQLLTVDSYGGTVELADAINTGTSSILVTNGTFDTKNYNVTTGTFSSSNTNIRTVKFGSSTITSYIDFSQFQNLTFLAGTSQITYTGSGTISWNSGGQTFYNVTFSPSFNGAEMRITKACTFNNLTISAPSSNAVNLLRLDENITIVGTLNVSGSSAVRRVFVFSNTPGTPRIATAGTLSADNCDFRDITIAGGAAGSSPTRAGDCGGNSGVTFPAPKTVYWNLSGSQNWSATAWASSSGGLPDINNFPLAQDTAVFDDTGAAGTITVDASWNIGTFDASARTSAMTFRSPSAAFSIYGDWKFGTGVTHSSNATVITFRKPGTQTITSNSVAFGQPIEINCPQSIVQLADAFSSVRNVSVTTGLIDAVAYNLTAEYFETAGTNANVKMGSGTWTLTGGGQTVWRNNGGNWDTGTANILLSGGTSTFAGAGYSYNKLTIGGLLVGPTVTITGNNTFSELASTKTVAHTIDFGSTTQIIGKWTITGSSGNVVTLSGSGTSHVLAGSATTGIDYLNIGSIRFATTSPGEFYAGANSTATGGVAEPNYLTATPTATTRYWVGGTGNWSDTNRWSTGSGGGGGASVPTSLDNVVFDALSNATSYTATVNQASRCNQLTFSGPASGTLTFAGSSALACHGNITLPATGFSRTYSGTITLSGSTTGKTITPNGFSLPSITINGIGCEWTLGSALNISSNPVTVTNGGLLLSTYNLTAGNVSSAGLSKRTINFGSGTIILSASTPIDFSTSQTARDSLTVVAGTSTINYGAASPTLNINNKTLYNVSSTSTSTGTVTINGNNTFNNFTIDAITSNGLREIAFGGNQTINGTLTVSASSNPARRIFFRSTVFGTARTLTCASVTMTNTDFRDITIAGAAAPASGTRIGDCKGNSGITFTAAGNKYWNLAAGGNWSSTGWATLSGGSPNANNFPLAQDTCIFEATGLNSGATVTIEANYNIGAIDMSARTTNTMTLSRSTVLFVHGNWINGTGTTLSGTPGLTFVGRNSQTITSAGVSFPMVFTIDSPGGTVTLQDALTITISTNPVITITRGTFEAATFNVTLSGALSAVSSTNSNVRTIGIGSGTWTIAGSNGWTTNTSTNLTVTGSGTISFTSSSAKGFQSGGASYANITINQGGAGTLSVGGIFKDVTNTYKTTGATAISFGTSTTRVSQFTAAGESGRLLTISGSSATSPCALVFTGSTKPNVDYLTITGVRAYDLTDTWYAGTNSVNNGSLGWNFDVAPAPSGSTSGFFLMFMPM